MKNHKSLYPSESLKVVQYTSEHGGAAAAANAISSFIHLLESNPFYVDLGDVK